ncbi:hypothetical protein [Paenibacillus macerans]|uniref:hypothetical protein n=1 Tax=Paenibacillus macerans TaxID=44252 RepID=UPI003D321623
MKAVGRTTEGSQMNVLGSFGNLYMAVLLIILVIGLLFAAYYLLKKTYGYIRGDREQKGTKAKTTSTIGGMTIMKTNGNEAPEAWAA